ncbi:delta-60 repeat domain-containing protein [Hymenobacter cellulosilyticus]|uniref:Delta-60 repeat domain-containing protein n=1 Tax=Hymenobacter cellulosilyticus TaxID=2932248 RepID=A0A8T9Q7T8_9BACT|nr:delta-60 repeat domain-containing protein [Hymenobacter cellulosilyticus]UOQ73636.1 delta-60 repeat domain-containing protein [Hymenobacter cellulosilyticus]
MFTDFNGTGRKALVRLQTTGALDTSYNPNVDTTPRPYVALLAVDPLTNQAVVNGQLGELTRLNQDGTIDNSFQTAATSYCIGLTGANNRRLIVDRLRRVWYGRGCVTAGSTEYLVRYLSNGNVDPQFSAAGASNGTVNVLFQQADGLIVAGGNFNQFLGVANAPLVRFTDQNFVQVDATFRPTLDAVGSVLRTVRQADGKLVIGGVFREVNGQPAANLARLNADGTLDAAFTVPAVNGPVQSLALQADGKIVLAGDFSTVAGVSSPSIARLLPNGTYDPGFTSNVVSNRAVTALAIQPDGAILLGGNSALTIGGVVPSCTACCPTGRPTQPTARTTVPAPPGPCATLPCCPMAAIMCVGSSLG